MDVPIVAIISVFGSAVLVVLIVVLFYHLNTRSKCRVMETAIINGKELPEDFFKPKPQPLVNRLLTGLIWIAVGVGFSIFSILEGETELFGLATIPFLVGVSYVIVYFVSKKNSENSDEQSNDQQA